MGFRSSAMPHFGQSPGLSDSTPGHIGQKYFAPADGFTSSSAVCPPQQDFFSGIGSIDKVDAGIKYQERLNTQDKFHFKPCQLLAKS
jgi:hypothetical protein